jgi:hypothetical protein
LAVAGIAVSRTFVTLFIDSAEPYELLSDGMIAGGWVRCHPHHHTASC